MLLSDLPALTLSYTHRPQQLSLLSDSFQWTWSSLAVDEEPRWPIIPGRSQRPDAENHPTVYRDRDTTGTATIVSFIRSCGARDDNLPPKKRRLVNL